MIKQQVLVSKQFFSFFFRRYITAKISFCSGFTPQKVFSDFAMGDQNLTFMHV